MIILKRAITEEVTAAHFTDLMDGPVKVGDPEYQIVDDADNPRFMAVRPTLDMAMSEYPEAELDQACKGELNCYICFWQGTRIEVHARTSYQARNVAWWKLRNENRRKVKPTDISVHLAERAGETVVHAPVF